MATVRTSLRRPGIALHMAFDSLPAAPVQHTLAASVGCEGVGLHSGSPVRLTLRPAPADTGVVFVRTDVAGRDGRIPVTPRAVVETRLHTEIANAQGVRVLTIEHLMAAFAGLGVDNVVVELDGPELPIMDGSAEPFVELIDLAGLCAQGAPRRVIEIVRPIVVADGDKRAALLPALPGALAGLHLDVEIDFASAVIGRQRLSTPLTAQSFRRDLAPARTFGFAQDGEALQAGGLARGGGLQNAVVVDGGRVLNPHGLRFADEFVRHKALDLVGDLYVLGLPISGRVEAVRPGHALNNALARALATHPAAWRVTGGAMEFARAS